MAISGGKLTIYTLIIILKYPWKSLTHGVVEKGTLKGSEFRRSADDIMGPSTTFPGNDAGCPSSARPCTGEGAHPHHTGTGPLPQAPLRWEQERGTGALGVTMHEVTSVSQAQDLCSEDRALPGEVNSDTIPATTKRPGEMMGRNYLSSLKCGMWCPAGPRRDITSMSQ